MRDGRTEQQTDGQPGPRMEVVRQQRERGGEEVERDTVCTLPQHDTIAGLAVTPLSTPPMSTLRRRVEFVSTWLTVLPYQQQAALLSALLSSTVSILTRVLLVLELFELFGPTLPSDT